MMYTDFYRWIEERFSEEVLREYSKNRSTWTQEDINEETEDRIKSLNLFEVLEYFEQYLNDKKGDE